MSPTHPQMVQREMCVERGGTTSSETGAWASGHPCSCSVGVGPCHTKASTPAQKGPADPGAPRSHGRPCGAGGCIVTLPRFSAHPGPSLLQAALPRPQTDGCWVSPGLPTRHLGPLGGSVGWRSLWLCLEAWEPARGSPRCLSLGLSLPAGLLQGAQALPSLGNRVVIRMPQAFPLLRGCFPSGQDAGTCTRAGEAGGWGHHGVGPWALNAAVQKLLGISGHY